jgi:quinol---cytochrome-c reductase cytochrome c subunit
MQRKDLRPVSSGLIVCFSFVLAGLAPTFAQTEPQPATPDGAALFARHCATCHGDHGQGISAIVSIAGPDIQAEHNQGQVLAAVETGPSHMPSFARILSVDEMRAVSTFVVQKLAVIPLSGNGDVSHGGILYRTYCAACHRTAVRGGALAFAGTNAPDLSEKSGAIIAGAIRSGPGAMPSFPPSLLDDKELASIVAYVRVVQHPPNPGGRPMHWYGPVPEGLAAWTAVFSLLIVTMWIERGGKG